MTEVLRVSNIDKQFSRSKGFFGRESVSVLDAVSFSIESGETLGLVGESGSGKTTVARCVMGMLQPDSGSIIFNGIDMASLDDSSQRQVRRELSIVYQNPYLSLNPHFTVHDLIAEPIVANEEINRSSLLGRVVKLLEQVGLSGNFAARKIGDLSGGQAQRVAIARALALKPKLIILDEPTSALDVSVQAQILTLLSTLQDSIGCSYLLITHDLDVVRHTCDRVLVMSQGKIVEDGKTTSVLMHPEHAYTQQLIAATPRLKYSVSR